MIISFLSLMESMKTMGTCTFVLTKFQSVSVAVYRITLFLHTISRNVYRGNLQASTVWVLLLKGTQA
jgi:hypothetical protein